MESSGQGGLLRLKGDFSLPHVGEVQSIVIDVLKRSTDLVINIDDVETIDISALQLLCSIHKKTLNEGKGFAVLGECNGRFKEMIIKAGFVRHTGCTLDEKKECLWFGGDYE